MHAVRGRRNEYKPLNSVLCESTYPVEVAEALKALEFSELYVADLDAITRGCPNFSLYKKLTDKTGFKLMLDAGVASIEAAKKLFDSGVAKVIIGTETLLSTSFVANAIESFGSEKIMVSLDLMGDRVLNKFEPDTLVNPMVLLRKFQEMGVFQIIMLDLEKVGSGEGVNKLFLKEIIRKIEARIYVGGGVQNIKELLEMKNLGVSGALVATALHSGLISPEEMKQAGLL